MKRYLPIIIPAVLSAALFGVLYGGGASSSSAERPTAGVRSVKTTTQAPPPGGVTASQEIAVVVAAQAYVDEQARIAAEAARIESERLAAEEAARQAAARQTAPKAPSVAPTQSYSGVGDCTGFSIPDYIIQRESGGNPYAVNPSSGAFGCGQVMPMHWNGGACSDLDKYNIADQRECVRRLSSDGTNLRPWAF